MGCVAVLPTRVGSSLLFSSIIRFTLTEHTNLCRECFAVMKCNDLIFGVGSVRINLKVLLVLEGSLIVGGLGCVVMSRNWCRELLRGRQLSHETTHSRQNYSKSWNITLIKWKCTFLHVSLYVRACASVCMMSYNGNRELNSVYCYMHV